MAKAIYSHHFEKHGLAWALAVSVLLHAGLLSVLPRFRFDAPAKLPALTLEIEKPEPPKPEIPKPPEPPKPVPPKPAPRPTPPPPRSIVQKPVEVPPPATIPEQAEAPRTETHQPPPVIAAAPKIDEPPAFTAPPLPASPPEPPKPAGPSDQDIAAARQAYGNALSREIGKYKRYPRIAQMRGWEGSVNLLLEIDSSGKIASIKIEEASEREVFNTAALEMAQKMVQPPPIPEALRGRSFSVRVPIAFRLE